MVDAICDQMVNGKGLLKICADENMPGRVTVYRWLASKPEFRKRFAEAREALMDFYAEQILSIAFDESGDVILDQGKDGKTSAVANHAKVQRDRLKVDSLKWTASRLFPKRYGDKMELLGQNVQEGESVNKIELVGVQAGGAFRWQDSIRVIVHPMLREDGSLIPQGTPEHDAAVEKAAQEARAKGAKSVRLGYDLSEGADASVADLMREVDGRTRSADRRTIINTGVPRAGEIADDYPEDSSRPKPRQPAGPPPQLTYQPAQPPADLSPEAWARITRVSDLIEQIAPSDEMPEAVFGIIEAALRRHYLGQRDEPSQPAEVTVAWEAKLPW
ncbi:terminase small subunit-like protein [Bradyrhizobium sp. USDA 4354]